MKILVTGAKGFVGKNLCEALKNIKEKKDRTRSVKIDEVFEYDIDNTKEQLDIYTKKCDFVFNLAGVNRPQNSEDFLKGNFGFASQLLDSLIKNKNSCPVMLSSSIQATLIGRYNNDYGKSKLKGEELFFDYERRTKSKVFVYRFPNLFGKWCKPNYNSAVATFCYNTAKDLPITVNDRDTELELLYIDDLVVEMLDLLEGKEHHAEFNGIEAVGKENGKYCFVPKTYRVTLGEIADNLKEFSEYAKTLKMPEIPKDSFKKKLYSTYLSYLPKEKAIIDLTSNEDERGSFTELMKTEKCGQFSVNVSNPGITKGEHWHNSKWEFFIVVSGKALIEQRKIGTDEVIKFEVSDKKIQAVHMLPGYTHNIINLSKTEKLVTLMWANEEFEKEKPDTYYEKVKK